jgi:hypothetical protein
LYKAEYQMERTGMATMAAISINSLTMKGSP